MMVRRAVVQVALCLLWCLGTATDANAFEMTPYQMSDGSGEEPWYQCGLQYYYHVPCPSYSWFWGVKGWGHGDHVGVLLDTGDPTLGGIDWCEHTTEHCWFSYFRVLDFAGYGAVYPGHFTVEFSIYCADEQGCPTEHIWFSGPRETHFGWNYVELDRDSYTLIRCRTGGVSSPARLLVTAQHIGTDAQYPEWGFDNISSAIEEGCPMHDIGCLPALYPRPQAGYYPVIHSGYYGDGWAPACPPEWIRDGNDTTLQGSQYGFLELAWRFYFDGDWRGCKPIESLQTTTWGAIKSMYR